MKAWIKLLAAALLFALWAALVFSRMADPKDLITGIELALVGLGVFHAATSGPGGTVGQIVAGIADLPDPGAPAEPALAAPAAASPTAGAPAAAPQVAAAAAPAAPTLQ